MDTEKENPNLIPNLTDSESANFQNESHSIELDMKDENEIHKDEKDKIDIQGSLNINNNFNFGSNPSNNNKYNGHSNHNNNSNNNFNNNFSRNSRNNSENNESPTLFLKYRSKNFQEIIGQDITVQTLTMGVLRNKLGHAFIFSGIRGTGKTSLARILAKSFNCELDFSEIFQKFVESSSGNSEGDNSENSVIADSIANPIGNFNQEFISNNSTFTSISTHSLEAIDLFLANNQIPCGKCHSCNEKNNIDIIEIDAASNTGVDDIRKIIDSSQYKPAISKYKVFIIDEVHMLSKSAFNALLKILEEPPAHVKFIFATTEIEKVPSTILSRCMKFHLNRVEKSKIAKHLRYICEKEGYEVKSEQNSMIAPVKNSIEELIGDSTESSSENSWNSAQNSARKSKMDSKIDNKAIDLIAQHGYGSVRDAISILTQAILFCNGSVSIDKVREMLCTADFLVVKKVFIALLNGDLNELMTSFAAISNSNPIIFLSDLIDLCGDCIKYKLSKLNGGKGNDNENYVRSNDEISNDARSGDASSNTLIDMDVRKNLNVDLSDLMRLWDMLINGGEDIKKTFNPNDSLEIVLIKCAYIKNSISPEKLIRMLNGLSNNGANGDGGKNNSGGDGNSGNSGHGSNSSNNGENNIENKAHDRNMGNNGHIESLRNNVNSSDISKASKITWSDVHELENTTPKITKFDSHELENISKNMKKDIDKDIKAQMDKQVDYKKNSQKQVNLNSFKDLIMHVKKSREPILYSFLLNDFYLVSFESSGKIRFFVKNNLNLASDLKKFLEESTKIKWNLEFVKRVEEGSVKEFAATKFGNNFEKNNVVDNIENNELILCSPSAPALLYSFTDIDQNNIITELKSILSENDYSIVDINWEME